MEKRHLPQLRLGSDLGDLMWSLGLTMEIAARWMPSNRRPSWSVRSAGDVAETLVWRLMVRHSLVNCSPP